jgi:methylenetetrahydrofolate dehydrogenase (NADP+)/methenyltetrahydrofolate cyclohydrolase
MTAKRIDGKAAALALRQEVGAQVAAFHERLGRAPGLAVVLVGEDPASAVYVRSKEKAAHEAGMESFEHRLPASASQETLLALVDELNDNPAVDGILVQLPLPPQIDERVVITRISPDKDVDGFHPVNAGRLAIGLHGFVPCTPLGCLKLLQAEIGDLSGKEAVIIGRSNIVGKPMALRPTTTARRPARGMPLRARRAMMPVGVAGVNPSSSSHRRPTLTGWKPSTSLSGEM